MRLPEIECYAHVELPGVSADSLTRRAGEVIAACLEARGDAVPAGLADLDEVEVSLLDDAAIARVHDEFMDDPTPTDVITFQHGEILISVETAIRCAAEHGHPAEREALLYLIHGLLHLNGHDDLSEPAREIMHRTQESLLATVWPLPGAENRE